MRRAARHRAGLVLLTAALACGRADAPRAATGVTVGAPAPAYAAQTLEGTPVALADLIEQVGLLRAQRRRAEECGPEGGEREETGAPHQRTASQRARSARHASSRSFAARTIASVSGASASCRASITD